jgi:hypothetical protein
VKRNVALNPQAQQYVMAPRPKSVQRSLTVGQSVQQPGKQTSTGTGQPVQGSHTTIVV